MCIAPKKIQIDEHTVYVPCGKCLECQNQSRSEWVLRSIYELKKNPYAYFVTLTYDDEFLPAPYMDDVERSTEFALIKSGKQKNYGHFVLDKDHAKQFLSEFKQKYLITFCTSEYETVKKYRRCLLDARKSENVSSYLSFKLYLREHPLPYPRYMLTGEYGTLKKRPHLHILFFLDRHINNGDLLNLCKSCWNYGNVELEIPETHTAVFNYISKHQIKEDCGTKFQMAVSPIFKLTSTYTGGIGSNLKNDLHLRWKYEHRENGISQVIELPYKDSVNTFPFPRYLRKHFHPENLNIDELRTLEKDSLKHVFSIIPEIPASVDNIDDYIKICFQENRQKDWSNRMIYFDNKFKNKLLNSKFNQNGQQIS